MSYWKVESAIISDNGDTLKVSFEDRHSVETMTITLSAEVWKNIFIYKNAYEEPERRLIDAHKSLCNYLFNTAEVLAKCKQEEK